MVRRETLVSTLWSTPILVIYGNTCIFVYTFAKLDERGDNFSHCRWGATLLESHFPTLPRIHPPKHPANICVHTPQIHLYTPVYACVRLCGQVLAPDTNGRCCVLVMWAGIKGRCYELRMWVGVYEWELPHLPTYGHTCMHVLPHTHAHGYIIYAWLLYTSYVSICLWLYSSVAEIANFRSRC